MLNYRKKYQPEQVQLSKFGDPQMVELRHFRRHRHRKNGDRHHGNRISSPWWRYLLRTVDVFPPDLLATIVREPIFIPPLHLAWRGNGVPRKMSSSICEEYRLIINVVHHAEQTKMYIYI